MVALAPRATLGFMKTTNQYKYYRMLAVYGLYRSACRYRLGGEEGEVYDFEWGSGAVCGEVDSHVQPRS